MKIGIVDLGSNSFRLLLGTYVNGKWHNEHKLVFSTRLGDRDENGQLREDAIGRGLAALEEIQYKMDAYGATKRWGIATSAIRESSNGKEFLVKANQICPMEYTILSGEEEGRLGFLGATMGMDPNLHYATIDVGGGSTEIALGSQKGVYHVRSYPAGAVRMQELSFQDPQRVWEETAPMWDPLPIQGQFGDFIIIGGTATTLGAIDLKMEIYDPSRIQGHRLDRSAIEAMVLQLRYMSREDRLAVPGLQASRVDSIISGAEIITSLMDTYAIGSVIISESDGLEGWQMNYGQGT